MANSSTLSTISAQPSLRPGLIRFVLLCFCVVGALVFFFLISNGIWANAQLMVVVMLAAILMIVSLWPALA